MTPTITLQELQRERYSKDGGLPVPALQAFRIAAYRQRDAESYGWTEDGDALTMERDGFTLRATWELDEYMTLDDMGYGTFDETRGGDRWAVPMWADGRGRTLTTGDHANSWYHPMYSGDDWYRYARKQGASRQTADEWTRARAEREALDAAEAREYVLKVTASRAGITLGTAYLGGVGFEDEYAPEREVASVIDESGMIAEAVTEARATLRELREDA